jgi:hypothetical protein
MNLTPHYKRYGGVKAQFALNVPFSFLLTLS